jgi:hypothetical protein
MQLALTRRDLSWGYASPHSVCRSVRSVFIDSIVFYLLNVSLYLIVGNRNRHGHTGITLAMEEKPVIEIWVQKIAEWFQYVALNREN